MVPRSTPATASAATASPGFWQRARRHPSFVAGATLTALLIACALLSFVWTPWDPYAMDLDTKLQAPDARHWLGTDALGRDRWARVVHGSVHSLSGAFLAVAVGLVAGTLIGLLAGAAGGVVEH
jgi:peptide/nickel transport system permease protein